MNAIIEAANTQAANATVVSNDTTNILDKFSKNIKATFTVASACVKDSSGDTLQPPKRTAVVLIEELIKEKDQWFDNAHRTSNEQLYAILAKCYGLYLKMAESGTDAKRLRDGLNEYIESKRYAFSSSSHTLVKIVKCVFGADRRRVSAYGIVLRAALSAGVAEADIPQFIKDGGGVEEIRLARSPNAMTNSQKAQIAKASLESRDLAVVKSDTLTKNFDGGKIGSAVLLIGTWQADGSVKVSAVSSSQAALSAALASQYAALKEANDAHGSAVEATKSKHEVVDQVVASVAMKNA